MLKSTAQVPGLGYHAGGPCCRTNITELIVGSINPAARQVQPCQRTYPAGEKGLQQHRQGELDSRCWNQVLGSPDSDTMPVGPGGRADMIELIVFSIKSAARQAQPCLGALPGR